MASRSGYLCAYKLNGSLCAYRPYGPLRAYRSNGSLRALSARRWPLDFRRAEDCAPYNMHDKQKAAYH
ncbi:MAG: hypothetical protein FWH01_01570 [Oscillospiraceae bacterium]|nr:hypothetical protein [Oscillospiraceae bacterium]